MRSYIGLSSLKPRAQTTTKSSVYPKAVYLPSNMEDSLRIVESISDFNNVNDNYYLIEPLTEGWGSTYQLLSVRTKRGSYIFSFRRIPKINPTTTTAATTTVQPRPTTTLVATTTQAVTTTQAPTTTARPTTTQAPTTTRKIPVINVNTTSTVVGQSIRVDATGDIIGDYFDMGDGTIVAAQGYIYHTYTAPGTKTIRIINNNVPVIGTQNVNVTVSASTTAAPTTQPTTAAPTTQAPTTAAPTTPAPTTAAPTTPRITTIAEGISWRGPIVITRGGVYTGNFRSTDPNVAAIKIETSEPVFLENVRTESMKNHIWGPWTRTTLKMRNVRSKGLNPSVDGKNQGRWVALEGFVSFDMENCSGEKTAGVYLNTWYGAANQSAPTVNFQRNYHKNVEGRKSNGAGGLRSDDTFERMQMLQFNSLQNIPRVKVLWNHALNEPYLSHVEDTFNFYNSSGTGTDFNGGRIEIAYNFVDGTWHGTPGSRYSGGGIIVGDGGYGRYYWVHHNAVVRSSNYSLANAGAHADTLFEDNKEATTGFIINAQGQKVYTNWNNDAGYYNRKWHNPAKGAWDPTTVIFRRNEAAHSYPTADNPNRRWDYSINNPDATPTDPTNTQYLPNNVAVPESRVQSVVNWWEGMRATNNVTIGASISNW